MTPRSRAPRSARSSLPLPGAPGKGKEDLADLGARERCVMTPLVIAMLVLGIWSAPLVSALTPVASDLDLATSQVGATSEGSAQ